MGPAFRLSRTTRIALARPRLVELVSPMGFEPMTYRLKVSDPGFLPVSERIRKHAISTM